MNKFPIVDMLAFFCRYNRLAKPAWRPQYVRQVAQIRSCYSKVKGGIRTSYYSVETKDGEIIELEFNQEELLWSLDDKRQKEGLRVDRVLVHVKRHKHQPSDAHRLQPIRFEVLPVSEIERPSPLELPLIERMAPFRFQRRKAGSTQVHHIETKHLENTMITKHLHYVVEDIDQRFYHLVYTLDQMDWRFMQEVDREFFFVR
ncbi:hypothetical protein [Balneola vulgaris]|uniref:hypothetical protein n=1 Tax=Balneola vulgaris TaxID=287535 RepID=UPI0003724B6C|nr:hypothetical protein [Balneola vulgaris]